jgi:D-psicose/D-tagatose/L-ribulose 3-epimerase
VADDAKAAGVVIALEPLNRFECYLCNTVEQAKKLVDLVAHDNIQAMYDTHHANIEEKSQQQAIEAISSSLAHVHISENDRGTPGQGSIDWDAVFSSLAAVQYDGWLTIESFSRRDVEFANAINVWREYSPVEEVTEQGCRFIRSMLAKHFS